MGFASISELSRLMSSYFIFWVIKNWVSIFVVAALLLQGSVQVYSKKVEYLYNLVLRTLEFLSKQRFVLLDSLFFP